MGGQLGTYLLCARLNTVVFCFVFFVTARVPEIHCMVLGSYIRIIAEVRQEGTFWRSLVWTWLRSDCSRPDGECTTSLAPSPVFECPHGRN